MAARDIVASFAGCCGQRCMAASVLILVDEEQQSEEAALDGLLAEILETASKLVPGQEGGQVGPLIDPIAKKRSVRSLIKPFFCIYGVREGRWGVCMYHMLSFPNTFPVNAFVYTIRSCQNGLIFSLTNADITPRPFFNVFWSRMSM
jgi:hypothetical protein